MNERLSAFLDGEANGDEVEAVVSQLMNDETARRSWSRQNWIRTTLRATDTDAPAALDLGFADRVMHAIESEDKQRDVVVPMATARRARIPSGRTARPRRHRRAWQGMAGMGMAAAVAGGVFVSSSPFGTSSRSGAGSMTASTNASSTRVASSESARREGSGAGFGNTRWNEDLVDFASVQAADASSRNVRSVASQASRTASDRWSVNDPAVREELNGYLVDHNGMARGYGMSSTTPGYVRVATYGQGAAQ